MPSSAPEVLLATCALLPDGEEWTGTRHLPDALAAAGIDGRWAVWDDPSVDWSRSLVAVRATWDYDSRRDEFLAWASSVPWLLNGADVFAWNTDKAYLVELIAAGVPVVPTTNVDHAEDLRAAMAAYATPIVKPRVGAGGRGVVVGGAGDHGRGPWIVQPLVESVREEGEHSVFVLDGRPVSQARKIPAKGEIRVHEQYGGRTIAVEPTDEARELATGAVRAAEALLGHRLDYARVDAMRLPDGTLAVSELEATEPGLYLDVIPGNAEAFVGLLADRLAARSVDA